MSIRRIDYYLFVIFITFLSYIYWQKIDIFKFDCIFQGFILSNFIKTDIPENVVYAMPSFPFLNYVLYSLPDFFDFIFIFLLFLSLSLSLVNIFNLIYSSSSEIKFNNILLVFILPVFFHIINYLDFEQLFYSATIFLFLNFSILRFKCYQDRTFLWDFLTGFSLAITLFVRSPMFLFPIILIIYDFYYFKKSFSFKKTLILLFSSYVFLVPWVYLIWVLTGKIVLFEYRRPDVNIIAGALGMIETVEGDIYRLVNISPEDSIIRWAIIYILNHPFDYFLSFLNRIFFFVKLNSIFIILTFISFFMYKKNNLFKLILLYILYFVSIHCLMPVEKRYFIPASIGIILAGFIAIAGFIKRYILKNKGRYYKLPDEKIVIYQFIPLFAFTLICIFFVSLYPFFSKSIETKSQILAKMPLYNLYYGIEKLKREEKDAILYIGKYLNFTKRKDIFYDNVRNTLEILSSNNEVKLKQLIMNYSDNISYPFNLSKMYLIKLLEKDRFNEAMMFIENNRKSFMGYTRSIKNMKEKEIANNFSKSFFKINDFMDYMPLLPSYPVSKEKIIVYLLKLIKIYGNYEDNFFIRACKNKKNYYGSAECNMSLISKIIGSVISLESKGKFREALSKLQSINVGECYKIYLEKGNCYFMLKDYEEAIKNFKHAFKLCLPYVDDIYYALICSYKYSRKKDKLSNLISYIEMDTGLEKDKIKKIISSCK